MTTVHDVMDALRSLSLSGTRTATVAERTAYKTAVDMLEEAVMPRDNGDGTVTLLREVTVPKEWLNEGRDVVAVRAPRGGEWYVDAVTGAMCVDPLPGYHRCPRVIMSDARPKFREGGYYRTRGGDLVGPLCKSKVDISGRTWSRAGWIGWFADGRVDNDGTETSGDLLPGEVTVWQPPASLPADEWRWRTHEWQWPDGVLGRDTRPGVLGDDLARILYEDWMPPPKPGRYKVPGGGKVATWEGE